MQIEDTRIDTWSERDRAMVVLYLKKDDSILLEYWDQDVCDLVEDGFLSPKNWHKSAFEYYVHLNGGSK